MRLTKTGKDDNPYFYVIEDYRTPDGIKKTRTVEYSVVFSSLSISSLSKLIMDDFSCDFFTVYKVCNKFHAQDLITH